MKPITISVRNGTVEVDGIRELDASNSDSVRDLICHAISEKAPTVEMDLSTASIVDYVGLGTLLAVHQTAWKHLGRVHLLNPSPAVRQTLELARMDRMFPGL